jgi:hypothetical protein
LQVTFEEGTCAAWLHGLLKPHVRQVLVYDPRKNALLKVGNKSDRIDARKLAELLRSNCCARCISGFLLVFLSKNASDLLLALTEHCLAEAFPIKASDDSGFVYGTERYGTVCFCGKRPVSSAIIADQVYP